FSVDVVISFIDSSSSLSDKSKEYSYKSIFVISSSKISIFVSFSAKTDCANKNELQNIMKDKMITLFHKTIIFPPFSHTLPFLSIIHKEGESSVKISNKSQCVLVYLFIFFSIIVHVVNSS